LNLDSFLRDLDTRPPFFTTEYSIIYHLEAYPGFRVEVSKNVLIQGIVATCHQGVWPFITEHGLLELAYGDVQIGDQVFVLPYCKTAMVLRSVNGRACFIRLLAMRRLFGFRIVRLTKQIDWRLFRILFGILEVSPSKSKGAY
jgi:hypothetical protein